MEDRFYVYAILDNNKPGKYSYDGLSFSFLYEPFYVGKGTGSRCYEHLMDSRLRSGKFLYNKIKKMIINDNEPIIVKVLENISDDESLCTEVDLISKIGRRDLKLGTLVNLTDGGEGMGGHIPSQKTKDKISKTKKSQKLKWIYTEESVRNMSIAQSGNKNGFYGKNHTEEVKETHSKLVSGTNHPMFGKKHSEETIELIKVRRNDGFDEEKFREACKKQQKVVLQYDLDDNFIEEFSSIKDASEKTGINQSVIGKCCRGVIKKPTRYFFKFKNIEDKLLNNSYFIKIGDDYNGYKLIKRTKITSILEKDGELITIRKKDNSFLWKKVII